MELSIKNASIFKKENLSVSSDVISILPEALIRYIWELAQQGGWKIYKNQFFTLESGNIPGKNVQNIFHECKHASLTDTRKVYGVEPVNCKLEVSGSHGNYQMQLCSSL